MVWLPTESVLMEMVAVAAFAPEEARFAVPSAAVPSEKLTEPVGAPGVVVDVLVTVAVNVTDWPYGAGLELEASVVVVGDSEMYD